MGGSEGNDSAAGVCDGQSCQRGFILVFIKHFDAEENAERAAMQRITECGQDIQGAGPAAADVGDCVA